MKVAVKSEHSQSAKIDDQLGLEEKRSSAEASSINKWSLHSC